MISFDLSRVLAPFMVDARQLQALLTGKCYRAFYYEKYTLVKVIKDRDTCKLAFIMQFKYILKSCKW